MSKGAALPLFILFSLLLSFPVHAKSPEELKKLEATLESQKTQETALKKKEQTTSAGLQQLQQQLINATKALQDKQTEAEELSDKLQALTKESETKSSTLKSSRAKLSSLVAALLQISREPPEALLLHTGITTDQIHRGILLRTLLPQMQSATNSIASDLDELDKLRESVTEQKKLIEASEQNLTWQKSNLDQLIKARQGLLQKTSSQRAAIAKQLEALTAEAQDLRQLMQKVSQSAGWPKGVEEGAKSPTLRQGLKLPVSGKMTRPYGVRDSYGVLSQGLTIAAATGSPIVAPKNGRVVFAGPFKGYGQIVILAHIGGYHSFLAGFGRIDAEIGQEVAAGEPLGTLPEKTASNSSRPELYFEWRKRGEPINPLGEQN
ncbi:MAG: peptidoglycan DD-metalloendopeptidase family protein [Alphaproteobacteria bacterium]|nr:peptidoglycan DD-metalloendopeptidase family protein [Alphaproteobacteria bacterium]